jgi:hypothetical protein
MISMLGQSDCCYLVGFRYLTCACSNCCANCDIFILDFFLSAKFSTTPSLLTLPCTLSSDTTSGTTPIAVAPVSSRSGWGVQTAVENGRPKQGEEIQGRPWTI